MPAAPAPVFAPTRGWRTARQGVNGQPEGRQREAEQAAENHRALAEESAGCGPAGWRKYKRRRGRPPEDGGPAPRFRLESGGTRAGCCAWLLMAPLACVAAPLDLHGELVQGGLVHGQTVPAAAVFFDGRRLRVSPQGVFVFGFGRDAPSRKVLRIEPSATGAGALNRTLEVRSREYAIQRIDRLDARKVNPQPQDLERIRKEGAQIARVRLRDDARTDFLGGFSWPLHGVITGVYGSRRILNGQPRRPHFGVDIACRAGTPITAPAAGVATFVHGDMFFSGATLVLDHGHGVSSTFLHLQRVLVAEQERVERGQVIAEVGASGRVTGAHLDWRVNWFGERLDPALLTGEMPEPSPECKKQE